MPRCCQRREAPPLLLTPNIDIRPTVYHVTESEPVVTAHAVQITILTARNGSVKRVWLVSWCFEPSQPQRIPSGLKTNFTLSPSHSFHKSSFHKLCFLSLFIFHGHSTREPASSRETYFILRAYTGTGVSHSQHRKKIEILGKTCR